MNTHDDGRNSAVFAVGWLDELAKNGQESAKFRKNGGPWGVFARRGTRKIKITVLRFIFPRKKSHFSKVTPKLPITPCRCDICTTARAAKGAC